MILSIILYTYATGNRTQVKDDGNINNYIYDTLNRVTGAERNFDGATYQTGYQYTKALLTGIQYPGATSWLKYNYDNFNRVSEVAGFTKAQGITYDADDAVQNITYANGVTTSFTYDNNRRLQDLTSGVSGKSILKQHYEYDATNNITSINDKLYEYDANNQLTKAITPGKFMETKVTPGSPGVVVGDYLGSSNLYFGGDPQAMVKLDYDSSSIGIDFGGIAPGVKKLLLVPDKDHQAHRITQGTFDIYHSNDNAIYTVIPRDQWEFVKDGNGVITVTFKQKLATRYLKIHVLFDNRDSLFKPKDRATFLNTFAKMLQIYQEADSQTEEYAYDGDGNRKFSRITLIQATENESLYYPNSDRLKTDGKYLYSYDNGGNLISKERTNLNEGETAEKWQYQYDLLNRLIRVTKNGTIVSEYAYDPEGIRVVKKAKGQTIHYVFEGTEPVYEKNVTAGKVKSYVYALGKHLARVDGVIGDLTAKVYFYHTDQLGSVRAITDQSGKVVFNVDYFAFGARYISNGDFDEELGFTGKEYDVDIELYYYNARWYDPETGRFISEDPAADPNNPNLYSYCGNNPVIRTDSSGEFLEFLWVPWVLKSLVSGLNAATNGGDFWSGFSYGLTHNSLDFRFGTGNNQDSYTNPEIDLSQVYGYNGEDNQFLDEQYFIDQDGEPNGSGSLLRDSLFDSYSQANNNPGYYFSQKDPRWANIIYSILDPSDPDYPQTIASSGCGPTSAAMAISRLTGKSVTPITTAQYALDNGYRTRNDGTNWGFFCAIGKHYGLTVIETTNFYDAKRFLRNCDCIVVASMGPGHFTGSGHYIVFSSTNVFTTHVLDPNSKNRSRDWWDLTLAKEGKRYFIFMK